MEKKISTSQIREAVQKAHNEVKKRTGGKNADYIPYLVNIDSGLSGLNICSTNGQTINIGDTDYHFGIESVSEVHTAILILRQYDAQKALDIVDADATGLSFNSIIAILLENDHPSAPLVSAGAIFACSMTRPTGNSDRRWNTIIQNITELYGSTPQLIDELYQSEIATNFDNRSIAWLLKNHDRIYGDPELAFDLYTHQRSLGVTAGQLSIVTGTIVNNGVNPAIGQHVFEAGLAPKITSMISSVGFYEHSGDQMYTTGIPAKSDVGDGVIAVLPGVMGISVSALPLDGAGDSIKVQMFIRFIMNRLGLDVFNGDNVTITEQI